MGAWLSPLCQLNPAREFLSALREKGYFDERLNTWI